MTSQEAYAIFLRWVNEPITGNVSEADFEDYFHASQIEHASWLVGKKQGYKTGFPEPPVNLSATLGVTSSLRCLRKPVWVNVKSGLASFNPSDIFHGPVDISITADGKCGDNTEVDGLTPLTQMNDDEWALRTTSHIMKPTLKNPVWAFLDNERLRIAPKSIDMVLAVYYRNPPRISVSNNIDPVWLDGDTMVILWRSLKQAGLNLTDGLAMQMGAQMERSDS